MTKPDRQKPGRKIRPSVHLDLDLPALTRLASKAAFTRLQSMLDALGWDRQKSTLPPTLPGLLADVHAWVTTGAGGLGERMHRAHTRGHVLEALNEALFVAPVDARTGVTPEVGAFTPDLAPLVGLVRAAWCRHELLAGRPISTVDLALVAGVVPCRIRQVISAGYLTATAQTGNHPAMIAPKEATRWLRTRGIDVHAKPADAIAPAPEGSAGVAEA